MADRRASEFTHEPVLLAEVVDLLALPRGGVFVDFTVGSAGHLCAIASASDKQTRLFGVDRDPQAVAASRARLAGLSQFTKVIHASFGSVEESLACLEIEKTDAALFDLGLSSPQIDHSERGFSFQRDASLDMRMDTTQAFDASDLIMTAEFKELREIISSYGEERRASRIARAIVRARDSSPITTTGMLRDVIAEEVGQANLTRTLARVFQALRIKVNEELEQLRTALPLVIASLNPGGRLGVISYHSLEDRIVKQLFVKTAGACQCPPRLPICVCGARAITKTLTPKPIRPSDEEVARNPRARSAKFRVVEKLEYAGQTGGQNV